MATKANKQRIRLTKMTGDFADGNDYVIRTLLMLRTARKVGDEEVVNMYVLSILRRHKAVGVIDFEEID